MSFLRLIFHTKPTAQTQASTQQNYKLVSILSLHRHGSSLRVAGAFGEDTGIDDRVDESSRSLGIESPSQKLVGLVLHKAVVDNVEALAILCDLVPVALDILQVVGHVAEGALEDLAVDFAVHVGLHFDKEFVGSSGLSEHVVSATLHGAHEGANLLRVVGDESLVANEQDLVILNRQQYTSA